MCYVGFNWYIQGGPVGSDCSKYGTTLSYGTYCTRIFIDTFDIQSEISMSTIPRISMAMFYPTCYQVYGYK